MAQHWIRLWRQTSVSTLFIFSVVLHILWTLTGNVPASRAVPLVVLGGSVADTQAQLTTGATEQLGGELAKEKWMSMRDRLDSEWRPLVFVSLNIHVTWRMHVCWHRCSHRCQQTSKSMFLCLNEALMSLMPWDLWWCWTQCRPGPSTSYNFLKFT